MGVVWGVVWEWGSHYWGSLEFPVIGVVGSIGNCPAPRLANGSFQDPRLHLVTGEEVGLDVGWSQQRYWDLDSFSHLSCRSWLLCSQMWMCFFS